MGGRVFLYVQHLLGIGHLLRAARLAKAMAAAGLYVDVVSGGMAVPFLDTGGAALFQLPPLKAGPGGFSDLVDEAGEPAGEALMEERRRRLLAFFAERRPDAVIIETFPFGRRQMRFEVGALLEAALGADPRPLVISSVRDILQAKRQPGRAAEAADMVESRFDFVLVHGDARFAAFEETFPEAARIAGKLHYTGLVTDPPAAAGAAGGRGPGFGGGRRRRRPPAANGDGGASAHPLQGRCVAASRRPQYGGHHLSETPGRRPRRCRRRSLPARLRRLARRL